MSLFALGRVDFGSVVWCSYFWPAKVARRSGDAARRRCRPPVGLASQLWRWFVRSREADTICFFCLSLGAMAVVTERWRALLCWRLLLCGRRAGMLFGALLKLLIPETPSFAYGDGAIQGLEDAIFLLDRLRPSSCFRMAKSTLQSVQQPRRKASQPFGRDSQSAAPPSGLFPGGDAVSRSARALSSGGEGRGHDCVSSFLFKVFSG